MSRVSEILQSLAANAGRSQLQRGQILGQTIASASEVPGQIITDRERRAIVAAQQARENATLVLRQNEDVRQTAEAGQRATKFSQEQGDYLQNKEKETTLRAVISAGFAADKSKFDDKAAIDFAQKSKYPELVSTVQDIHAKLTKPVVPPIVAAEGATIFGGEANPETGKLPVIGEGKPKTGEGEAFSEAQNILAIPEANRTSAQNARLAAYQDLKNPTSTSTNLRLKMPDGSTKDVPISVVPTRDGKGSRYFYQGQDVSDRVSAIPSASTIALSAGALSTDALEMNARKYLVDGTLPPGYGTAGVAQKAAIMNRAAQIDPNAALARNQAVFKADAANLVNLQKTEGTLSAFEKTAGKNLDQFLTLANKIPDTGVPWLNTPVRLLSADVVGNANMAAITAARDVALREIGRVTSDPKLSGALTDAARAEVLGLSKENATLPQIKAVAKVLKQDMANVHAGITEQISTVKTGIGSYGMMPPPAEPAAPPAATPPALAAPAAGRVRIVNIADPSKSGTILTTDAVPAGWKKQ